MQWIAEPKMDIVERLDTVREGMEAGLDDWPVASQIYEYKTAADEISMLRKRVIHLEKSRSNFAENAENLLIQLKELTAERDALLAALERIADPRNTHFAGDAQVVARAAIASVKEKQND